MATNEERRGAGEPSTRAVVYCVIPADLAPKLHDHLRAHFRDEPGVEVVVERRGRERRRTEERRAREGEPPRGRERREIRSLTGRRIGERRAAQVLVEPLPLPRRARAHAERIAFLKRVEPPTEEAEDRDTARIVMRVQGGDREAFGQLYLRYFDRLYSYLRVVLRNRDEAEDATQQVFTQALEAIDRYERRSQPFRAWLFVAARNYAVAHMRKHARVEPTEQEELDRVRAENGGAVEEEFEFPNWISDTDLSIFVERLPLLQRQALTLRYALGFDNAEIARIMGRSPESVRMLQSRATAFLRDRLTAIGRAPKRHEPKAPTTRWPKQSRVLRARRFSLTDNGPAR